MKPILNVGLLLCVGLVALLYPLACTPRSPAARGKYTPAVVPPHNEPLPAEAALNAPKNSPGADVNPWSGAARDVLAHHCGSCHQGDLPTAVPAALAVFDLLKDDWYEQLTPKQLDGVLLRIRGTKAMEPVDAATVEQFVRCARDGACERHEVSVLGLNELR